MTGYQARGPSNGCRATSLIAMFMGPTWSPPGADRTQVGPMLAPWTLLSGMLHWVQYCIIRDKRVNGCHYPQCNSTWLTLKQDLCVRLRVGATLTQTTPVPMETCAAFTAPVQNMIRHMCAVDARHRRAVCHSWRQAGRYAHFVLFPVRHKHIHYNDKTTICNRWGVNLNHQY